MEALELLLHDSDEVPKRQILHYSVVMYTVYERCAAVT